MNPFSKRDIKRAAWRAAKTPEKGGAGWLILGAVIILALLKIIFDLVKP